MQRITKPEVFKERLTEARNEKDMLLKQLAAASGINFSAIRLYSSGERTPGKGNLNKLAAALDVSPEWLAGDIEISEIIVKVEHEIEYQRTQAKEYKSGIYKDEILFARYDQAAKILEWVLKLLKGV